MLIKCCSRGKTNFRLSPFKMVQHCFPYHGFRCSSMTVTISTCQRIPEWGGKHSSPLITSVFSDTSELLHNASSKGEQLDK